MHPYQPVGAIQSAASNTANGENPTYTAEMFLEDFPQFRSIPARALATFVTMANGAISLDRWAEKWPYAMGLYIAHYCTLHLQTYNENVTTQAQAAQGGMPEGLITAEASGDTSVRYDHSALIAGTQGWGMWNGTQYGRMLATEARLLGAGGAFII